MSTVLGRGLGGKFLSYRGTKLISYQVKGTGYRDDAQLSVIEKVALNAVKQANINPNQAVVLLRGEVHDTTTIAGRPGQKDPQGMHLTMSVQDDNDRKKGQFRSFHVYVDNKTNLKIRSVSLAEEALPVDFKSPSGKRIWPENLPQKDVNSDDVA